MEIKDIINLVNAGYSRKEIEAMANAVNKPEKKPETKPEKKPETNPETGNDTVNIAEQLAALTRAIQANGIMRSNQPQEETADDILANIINPFVKE